MTRFIGGSFFTPPTIIKGIKTTKETRFESLVDKQVLNILFQFQDFNNNKIQRIFNFADKDIIVDDIFGIMPLSFRGVITNSPNIARSLDVIEGGRDFPSLSVEINDKDPLEAKIRNITFENYLVLMYLHYDDGDFIRSVQKFIGIIRDVEWGEDTGIFRFKIDELRDEIFFDIPKIFISELSFGNEDIYVGIPDSFTSGKPGSTPTDGQKPTVTDSRAVDDSNNTGWKGADISGGTPGTDTEGAVFKVIENTGKGIERRVFGFSGTTFTLTNPPIPAPGFDQTTRFLVTLRPVPEKSIGQVFPMVWGDIQKFKLVRIADTGSGANEDYLIAGHLLSTSEPGRVRLEFDLDVSNSTQQKNQVLDERDVDDLKIISPNHFEIFNGSTDKFGNQASYIRIRSSFANFKNGLGSSNLYISGPVGFPDKDGFYTGESGKLIEHPIDIMHFLLREHTNYISRGFVFDLDSIEDSKSRIPDRIFAGSLTRQLNSEELINRISAQAGVVWTTRNKLIKIKAVNLENPQIKWILLENKHILRGGNVRRVGSELFNDFTLSYAFSYVTNEFSKVAQRTRHNSAKCKNSQLKYGGNPRTKSVEALDIYDDFTANKYLDHLELWHTEIPHEFECSLIPSLHKIEEGDFALVSHSIGPNGGWVLRPFLVVDQEDLVTEIRVVLREATSI